MNRWEVFSEKIPFDGVKPLKLITLVTKNGRPEPMPKNLPEDIKNIITSGWSQNPSDRPTMEQIHTQLQSIEASTIP